MIRKNWIIILLNFVVQSVALRKNIALNKDSMQSSTYKGGNSYLANDGIREQNFYDLDSRTTCSHTLPDQANYWWTVDLGEQYAIDTITIYNRVDCCRERLTRFFIYIYNPDNSTCDNFDQVPGQLCFYHDGAAPDILTIACNKKIRGRFVKIYKEYKYHIETDALNVCEVEIYADQTPNEGLYCKQTCKHSTLNLEKSLKNATRLLCASLCRNTENCLGFNMAVDGSCFLVQTSKYLHGDGNVSQYYERC